MMKSIHPTVLFLALSGLLSACATTSQSSAEATYKGFVKACARHSEDAYSYLRHPDKHLAPCPDEGDYPAKIKADIIATSPRLDIVKSSDGWQFYTGSYLDPDSVKFSLLKLKYAILNRDVAQLATVIEEPLDETELENWVNSADAADIYAAIAAHPMPFFALMGDVAECEVSGRILRFRMRDGHWKWVMHYYQ
ncbi:MAG: hypothetical protein IJU23_08845 [Proteobacteria bacterium]|nr:hypothetical protein [Pseudomonadota bacterium]